MYNFSSLEKYLDTILVREKVPGFDIAVTKDGKEVFRYFGGYADKENGIKMEGKELYNMYSASKPITCAAGVHALEEGKFALTHPVWWYIPAFKDIKVKERDENGNITLRNPKTDMRIIDLFNMTGGLNYDLRSAEIREAVEKNPAAPTVEIAKAIAKMNIDFDPSTHWQYSLCHDVLAAVIEVATETRFADYVKKSIFDPLGMENSFYHIDEKTKARMCAQYCFNYSKGIPERISKDNEYVLGPEYDSGGAGIISCVEDYEKFASAMANYGVGRNGVRILSKAAVELMKTNSLNPVSLIDFQTWPLNAVYGYGLGVRTKIGYGRGGDFSSVGTFGWDGAAGSLVSVDTEKNLSIVYFQHLRNPQHEVIHPKIKNFVNQIIE